MLPPPAWRGPRAHQGELRVPGTPDQAGCGGAEEDQRGLQGRDKLIPAPHPGIL